MRLLLCGLLMAHGLDYAPGSTRALPKPQFLRQSSYSIPSVTDLPPAPIDGPPAQARCVNCLQSFWIINTRCLPTVGCCGAAPFEPDVSRFVCGQGCQSVPLEDFWSEDDAHRITIVYVHGNLTSHQDAIEVCQQLRAQLPERLCSGQAVRLILWSWPSDCDAGRVRDTTAVAGARAATESYYFGRFATRLDRQQRLLVVGYSFGARITTGALHLLAGCPLGGRHLADQHAASSELLAPRMRAILLAAAIDIDWLIPGHFHGAALQPVERVAITINPRDMVLKSYRIAEKRNAPEPIGRVGPPLALLGSEAAKITTTQVTGDLGARHGSSHYFQSPQVISLIHRELQRFDDAALVARRH